jgi:microcompartment protein CcmL/EutN
MSRAEAVYVVEYGSISRGIGALDAMCKRAGFAVLHASPICVGKFLICIGGEIAAIAEAKAAAEPEAGTAKGEAPISSCLLTGTHPAILAYFRHGVPAQGQYPAALGIFEARTAAKGFQSLDAALKAANVGLLRVWLGTQLGGKLCWVLGGGVSEIQSGVAAARGAVSERDHAGSRVVIAPDPSVAGMFVR